jgi:hypothetical protein
MALRALLTYSFILGFNRLKPSRISGTSYISIHTFVSTKEPHPQGIRCNPTAYTLSRVRTKHRISHVKATKILINTYMVLN